MAERVAFVVTSDTIGESGELGRILMRGFLASLVQAENLPERVIFLNRGVLLTTEDRNVRKPSWAWSKVG